MEPNANDPEIDGFLPDRLHPERSVAWLIEHIRYYSSVLEVPLSQADLNLLNTSTFNFTMMVQGQESPDFEGLYNRTVPVMRAYIEHLKSQGATCVQVRRGLRVPEQIQAHYDVIFFMADQKVLKNVMVSVFGENQFRGEKRAWKSPRGKLLRK